MKNKKGFTLVELMAVVIILIIVIFIAINKVNKSTKEARDKTIVANAGLYVKAVNGFISEKTINDDNYESGKLTVSQLDSEGVTISGTKPDSGYVVFSNSEVKYACFVYSGYNITYDEGDFSDITRDECEDLPISYNFTYKNKEEVFTVPFSGEYILEVWGAQGGSYSTIGGYGAYSTGTIYLKRGDKLYINVGGTSTSTSGGYNGGGVAGSNYNARGGGGATSIATKSGLLSTLSGNVDKVLIVAGGGGGSDKYNGGSNGGAAGGISGMPGGYYRYNGSASFTVATGGTQTEGGHGASGAGSGTDGTFGLGGSQYNNHGGGGGGGYYGGGGGSYNDAIVGSGAGGSSYIGNSKLTEKSMYCYNCTTSNTESTNTISVNCAESDPTPECAKKDTGYARITYNINDLHPTDNLDDYQFVEYIESSGTQYINTNIIPSDKKGIYARLSSSDISSDNIYFGSKTGNNRFWAANISDTIYFGRDDKTNTTYNVATEANVIKTIKYNYNNNRSLKVDDIVVGSSISSLTTHTYPIYIFASNMAGTVGYYSQIKLYELIVTDNYDEIAHFKPCYHKTEGTIGLCETISKTFYSNSGTGTFIKGNDVANN